MPNEHSDHSDYHKEKIIGNLGALEDHLRTQPCEQCMDKHGVLATQYLEEEASTNPDANREELLALAERVREIRRRIQELNNMKHSIDQQKLQSTV
jgi:thiamine kinase-like enzyme